MRREARPPSRFVFSTRSGRPLFKTLVAVKSSGRRAGLNCGKCKSCLATANRECEHVFLHKFRASCLTNLLENGYGLRSVMKFAGHSTIESPERYLRPASSRQRTTHFDPAIHNGQGALRCEET
jgi:integrase